MTSATVSPALLQAKGVPESKRRPNLLFIGGDKCASTWVYDFLSSSAEVQVSEPKELFYFTSEYWRGEDWLERSYPPSDARWRVEVCHDYLYSACARDRVARISWFDELALIAAVRNPIDRAISSYRFKLKHGIVRGDFWSACATEPDILRNGFFAEDLSAWLALGAPMFVFITEDLAARGEWIPISVAEWLGIEVPELSASVKVNGAAAARYPAINLFARNLGLAARRAGMLRVVAAAKRNSALQRVLYNNEAPMAEVALGAVDFQALKDYYRVEVAELGALLSRDLIAEWGYGSAS